MATLDPAHSMLDDVEDGERVRRVGAKGTLIGEVLGADQAELDSEDDPESDGARTLDEFKQDFEDLLADSALEHIRRVVVLVDDLDRCLPETVVDTLETMRLFLSVPKMSFVIAADEEQVADALRDRYPQSHASGDEEEPARLYLHKIVQTTLRLPALSGFDTQAFLLLLLLQKRPENPLIAEEFDQTLARCTDLRTPAAKLDALEAPIGSSHSTANSAKNCSTAGSSTVCSRPP